MTLYAVYEKNMCIVTYKDGEKVYDTRKVLCNEAIKNTVSNPTKEQYTFKYWSLEKDGEEYDFSSKVTRDITLYAVYEIKKCNVVYIVDGVQIKTEKYEYGTVLNPEEPTKEGYTFKYWSLNDGGVASNSTRYAYDESYDSFDPAGTSKNWHGPVIAVKQLPTTSQWSNVSLTNTKRQITTEQGTTSTDGGDLPVFDYTGYAARLLTAQEVNEGCGFTVGSYTTGELSTKCKYLMENTKYSSTSLVRGGWLESPRSKTETKALGICSINRIIMYDSTDSDENFGVRPAIEVSKDNISY